MRLGRGKTIGEMGIDLTTWMIAWRPDLARLFAAADGDAAALAELLRDDVSLSRVFGSSRLIDDGWWADRFAATLAACLAAMPDDLDVTKSTVWVRRALGRRVGLALAEAAFQRENRGARGDSRRGAPRAEDRAGWPNMARCIRAVDSYVARGGRVRAGCELQGISPRAYYRLRGRVLG